MQRVMRVLVLMDKGVEPDAAYLREHQDLRVMRLRQGQREAFGRLLDMSGKMEAPLATRVYIMDPLGQLMMVFRLDPDATHMGQATGLRKDLQKLLYNSKAG